MLVQDSYPQIFLYEWDQWKNNHKCENDRPGYSSIFLKISVGNCV